MAEKKKKVSDLAKEAGIPSKEFLQILKKMKIIAGSASSTISEEEARKAMDLLKKVEGRQAKKPTAEKPAGKEEKALPKKAAKPRAKKAAGKAAAVKPAVAEKPKKAQEPVTAVKPKEPTTAPVKTKAKAPAAVKTKPPAKAEAPVPVKEVPRAKEPEAPVAAPPPPKRSFVKIRPERVLNPMPRPPIVTVMGHVDHGKTTLLDAIRQTNVAGKEAGQITQHIGAYEVDIKAGSSSGRVVFLDTPGHEAFTAMRARGAQLTDIVILVVSADDGVMPQTTEAIDHARAANVPIIVAINKIDKANANPEQVKQQLSNYNLIAEDWGGDTLCVPVSAIKRQGLDKLLETILLQAEMLELKADPAVPALATVIEARLDRHMGPVATVVVREGTLRIGDYFIITPDIESVSAAVMQKVRALVNDRGERIQEAPPSTPVEVLGLTLVPQTGEILSVIADKKLLKEMQENEPEKPEAPQARKFTLEDLQQQIKDGEMKELKIVLKTDVQGSQEAIIKAFQKLSTEEVRLNVMHRAVGEINEADIMLASASGGIIFGFNVGMSLNAKKMAEYEGVDVRLYRIIYEIVDDIKKAMDGLLPQKFEEIIIGRAEIQQVFKISNAGIAGSRVTDGKITRDAKVRLIREGKVVYDGKITSLRRFKDDVKECEKGFECGLTLDKFDDFKEHDVVQAYEMQPVAK